MTLENVVTCFSFEYDDNGKSIWSSKHGHCGNGDIHMVNLDYPHEFLTSVRSLNLINVQLLCCRLNSISSRVLDFIFGLLWRLFRV
ncbi:hypothetical protein NL676_015877 [Syzygium grande]|nr:hypothetical protein NL676_015877 [Syzygium grande]